MKITTAQLKQIIREEIQKEKAKINEASEFTIKGDTIRGTGDKHPDVVVLEDPDGVRLTQNIGGKKSVILLSKKQAKDLKNSL